MIKRATDADACEWQVIDLETGEPIPGVQWADDETGEYEVVVFDERGNVLVNFETNEILKQVKRGRIQLIRKTDNE